MHESLTRYIDQAREKGIDLSTVVLLLRSAGWKEKEIAEAISFRTVGGPVPERAGIGSARDAFVYLVGFTSLFASVISLIVLVFIYIDFAIPDVANVPSQYYIDGTMSTIRASLATIIVFYPLFLLVWWIILRDMRAAPERAKSAMWRWISFFTLFVGAMTIACDIVTLVYYLVEGDLTIPFVLKVAALLVIAAFVSAYLALTLRHEGEVAR